MEDAVDILLKLWHKEVCMFKFFAWFFWSALINFGAEFSTLEDERVAGGDGGRVS